MLEIFWICGMWIMEERKPVFILQTLLKFLKILEKISVTVKEEKKEWGKERRRRWREWERESGVRGVEATETDMKKRWNGKSQGISN